MFKFLCKLFCKNKPEVGEWIGSVHQIKEYLPIEHPLKYVKEHGNHHKLQKHGDWRGRVKGKNCENLQKRFR